MGTILKLTNLTKYYGKTLGIKDVSLELNKGEIFGFIGPNGAGKSTTIRTILNLINKTSGEVLFNGKPMDKNDIDTKKQIGYLPSEVSLYDDLTVKEMFDYHESFYTKRIHKRRTQLVERFKLDESKKIEELSLGNLKKMGIVLAFMHDPKLVILDEPTSGLDPIIQKEFYDLLLEEKEKGTTIFYSTHVLSEISKVCDRVGIIRAGKLLEVEPIKKLISKSLSFVTITSKDYKKIISDFALEEANIDGNTITFKNTVEANELIKKLSKYDIKKLYVEPASIEDIFMHYYE